MTHALTEKQVQYFRKMRGAVQEITCQMQGALNLICQENDIKVRVRLSDDCSELIEDAGTGS